MESAIQIVSFNIPYPPDYGGVIDVFYKIKALSEAGISIYLHCFEYDRKRSAVLEKYCAKVFYYQRKTGLSYQFQLKPYIVSTRVSQELLRHLASNPAPILFEGLHTCHDLAHPMLAGHHRLVRTHNVEHEYYLNLYYSERQLFKKLFFFIEAFRLKRYEEILRNAHDLLCISPNDNYYFERKYHHSHFIPAFHPFTRIQSKEGRGNYILFHGNLSVAENIQAVEFLIRNVFAKISQAVVIAGKSPNGRLYRMTKRFPHIQIVANPEHDEMEKLIQDAQICVLPTFQDTGLKLKLLASLFSGRFCIANSAMIRKTGLEHLCHQADTAEEMIRLINQLLEQDFTSVEIEQRRLILEGVFSNWHNAMKIVRIMNTPVVKPEI